MIKILENLPTHDEKILLYANDKMLEIILPTDDKILGILSEIDKRRTFSKNN